jgi:urea carboxylase
MSIEVLKPGALSTFQDLGRTGFQHSGVPVNGVMDERAHRIANWVVGNPPGEATLEMTLLGPSLRFECPAVIAICGAVLSATLDGVPLPIGEAAAVDAGAVLAFGRRTSGARAYLAVRGGFALAPVMGSVSTFVRGAYGGLEGRALRRGDRIGLRVTTAPAPATLREALPGFPARVLRGPEAPIRVVAGRHWSAFTAEAQRAFVARPYLVRAQSDRMGYRLEGEALPLARPLEIVSEPVSFGTVQVPPEGQPIVLMADCQTTGGYPKIGQVARVDLPRLAQRMPGETVRFAWVLLEEAQRLIAAQARVYEAMQEAVNDTVDRSEL